MIHHDTSSALSPSVRLSVATSHASAPVDVPILLDLPIILLAALVLDLQLLSRLVEPVVQALVHGRLAFFAPGVLAKLGIAVTVQPVDRRLAVPPGILFHDLFQALARYAAQAA